MLIYILSIVAGFILAEPLIGKVEALKSTSEKIHAALVPFQTIIGVVEVVVGIIGLVNWLQIVWVPYFYGGFPMVILAIVMGLLLAEEQFKKFDWGAKVIASIRPYQEYVGLAGLIIGASYFF